MFLQVASWGGDLLDRGILTVSLAPRDNHEAQVQFALERGIPAILGIISMHRLPFPANSFDMAHCSRCLIPWTEFGNFSFQVFQLKISIINDELVKRRLFEKNEKDKKKIEMR